MAVLTLAQIDDRLTWYAPALHAPWSATRRLAAERIDQLLDLRLQAVAAEQTGRVSA